jgi:hypothetical protein
MTPFRPLLAAWLGVALAAAPALAQPADADDKAAPAPSPDDAPPDDAAMEGVDENPGAPRPVGEEETAAPAAPPPRRIGYPIEEVLRPITLPAVTSEVGIDLRANIDPNVGATLRARYGITRQVQVGLRYGVGGAFDPDGDGGEGTTFKTGKAISIDATYLVFDWLAAQVSVPIYLDPFAIGLVLGAPVKFHFADKFALFAAQDIVEFNLDGFVPSVTNEKANVLNAAFLDNNTDTSDGTLRFSGGGIFQLDPDLALIGYFAAELRDFRSQDLGYPLEVTLQKSLSPSFDVAGRVGFDDLGEAGDTFGVRLSAQLRI